MGLGLLGGGVATARWLLEQGASLTVTDMKDEEALRPSLEKLKEYRDKIKYVLGRHEEQDFLDNEIIVINPDVPASNKFVELARQAGKQIENELTLFYAFSPSKKIVAVTGTRGKTTTANWAYEILKSTFPNTVLLGNDPEKTFLGELKNIKEESIVVIELPSYQLEIVDGENFKPHIALITNIYQDHLNRHKTMEEYASVKANIFAGQTKDDILILNKENEWTEFFLNKNPKSQILFTSENSIFTDEEKEEFKMKWGEHNLQNLLAASLAAFSMGVIPFDIKKSISNLPQIKFRQERVYESEKLEIYNDTAATSPDGAIAAIQRFGKEANIVIISGGTDRELDFEVWAETVHKHLKPEQLVLLSGSATEKMKKALGWSDFQEYGSLKECFEKALAISKSTGMKTTIVFSPGAKSFEKFKNEFDRGEQFNALVEDLKRSII